MKRYAMLLGSFIVSLLATGCIGEEPEGVEEDVSEGAEALVLKNAAELNGLRLNGTQVNGLRLNGLRLNGTQLNGIQLNAAHLKLTLPSGATVEGEALEGSILLATLSDGGSAKLRVDDVELEAYSGMDAYQISYLDGNVWVNPCGSNDQGAPIRAFWLSGVWDYQTATHINDPTQMTLACEGAVLAKCAQWGYAPWIDRNECDGKGNCQKVPGRAQHDACTRMVRADYCGDGVPHTKEGTAIDVWDSTGFMTQTPNSGLPLEAEWSPTGATCVAHTRWSKSDGSNPSKSYIAANCPLRWAGAPNLFCGGAASSFNTGKLSFLPIAYRSLLRNASAQNVE